MPIVIRYIDYDESVVGLATLDDVQTCHDRVDALNAEVDSLAKTLRAEIRNGLAYTV